LRQDAVDHSVRDHDQLAQEWIAEFWYGVAKLGMGSQQPRGPLDLLVQAVRRRRLLAADKRGGFD
jgi:hypothetical protein